MFAAQIPLHAPKLLLPRHLRLASHEFQGLHARLENLYACPGWSDRRASGPFTRNDALERSELAGCPSVCARPDRVLTRTTGPKGGPILDLVRGREQEGADDATQHRPRRPTPQPSENC